MEKVKNLSRTISSWFSSPQKTTD